jgi:hypothetical protein
MSKSRVGLGGSQSIGLGMRTMSHHCFKNKLDALEFKLRAQRELSAVGLTDPPTYVLCLQMGVLETIIPVRTVRYLPLANLAFLASQTSPQPIPGSFRATSSAFSRALRDRTNPADSRALCSSRVEVLLSAIDRIGSSQFWPRFGHVRN